MEKNPAGKGNRKCQGSGSEAVIFNQEIRDGLTGDDEGSSMPGGTKDTGSQVSAAKGQIQTGQ